MPERRLHPVRLPNPNPNPSLNPGHLSYSPVVTTQTNVTEEMELLFRLFQAVSDRFPGGLIMDDGGNEIQTSKMS